MKKQISAYILAQSHILVKRGRTVETGFDFSEGVLGVKPLWWKQTLPPDKENFDPPPTDCQLNVKMRQMTD